jgi:hypothetical protein
LHEPKHTKHHSTSFNSISANPTESFLYSLDSSSSSVPSCSSSPRPPFPVHSRPTAVRHQSLDYSIISSTTNYHLTKYLYPSFNGKSKGKVWSSGSGTRHELVIQLKESALIGWIKVGNKSTSSMELFVSWDNEQKDGESFVSCYQDHKMPHNKTILYPAGYLPCRFVKIRCLTGTPVSLNEIQLIGVSIKQSNKELGPEMHNLLVEHPGALMRPVIPHLQGDQRKEFRYPIAQELDIQPTSGLGELKQIKKQEKNGKFHLCPSSGCRINIKPCEAHARKKK